MRVQPIPHKNKVDSLLSALHRAGCEALLLVVQMGKNQPKTWLQASCMGRMFLQENPSLPEQFQDFCTGDGQDSGTLTDEPSSGPGDVDYQFEVHEQDTGEHKQVEVRNGSGNNLNTSDHSNNLNTRQYHTRSEKHVQSKVITRDQVDCSDYHGDSVVGIQHEQSKGGQKDTNDLEDCQNKSENITLKSQNVTFELNENAAMSDESSVIDSKGLTIIEYMKQFCKNDKCLIDERITESDKAAEVNLNLNDDNSVRNGNEANEMSATSGFTAQVLKMYLNLTEDLQGDLKNFCVICDQKVKSSFSQHIQLHKEFLEQTSVETCNKCKISLPLSYYDLHECVKKHTLKHANVTVNDIWDDILLFENNLLFSNKKAQFICSVCKTQLSSSVQYRKHLVQMHLFKYTCTKCGDVKARRTDMVNHLRQHSALPCLVCQQAFYHKRALMHHMRKYHRDQMPKYSCTICKRFFTSQARLINHKKTHKRTICCDIDKCGMLFRLHSELDEHKIKCHRKLVEKSRPFLCNICGQQFLRKGNLTAHQEWKHKIGSPEKCSVCNKTFPGRNTLSSHMKSHSLTQDYMCEICGISYKQRSGLFLHRKLHHGDPNVGKQTFKCELCAKEFSRKRSFQHHIIASGHKTKSQTIDDKNVFSCKVCGKLFGDKERWERHSLIHSSKDAFKCPECGKGFKDKSNLRKHQKMHAGTRPQCDRCSKTFRSVKQLNEHIAASHDNSSQVHGSRSYNSHIQADDSQECADGSQHNTAVHTRQAGVRNEMGTSHLVELVPPAAQYQSTLSSIPQVVQEYNIEPGPQDISNRDGAIEMDALERRVVEASLAAERHTSRTDMGSDNSHQTEMAELVYEGQDDSVPGTRNVTMETSPAGYMFLNDAAAPTDSTSGKERVVPWHKC